MASSLELSVLGPARISANGAEVGLGDRGRALLLTLALRRGRPVPRDELVELLWPASQRDGRNALQAVVSRTRRALGVAGERLVTRPGGYQLELPTDAIDAERFEQTVLAARDPDADAEVVSDQLAIVLSWWRGHSYGEVADDPAAVAAASRLTELRAEAIERRAEALLATGGGTAG